MDRHQARPDDAELPAVPPAVGNMWVPPGSRPVGPVRIEPAYVAPEPPRRGLIGPLLVVLLLVGAVTYGVGVDKGQWTLPWSPATAQQQPLVAAPPASPRVGAGPLDAQAVAGAVVPTLVNINVTIEPLGLEGAGTGIVLTDSGQVITSHHVIKGASSISVTDVGTGLIYDAKPIGYDSDHDIALLQLANAGGLPTAKFGDSSGVAVGDQVAAIGNAGGVGGVPTPVTGAAVDLDSTIVARNDADFSRKYLTGLIEVDADVAPGQSGGSLVNRVGEVVGVIAAASTNDTSPEDPPAQGSTPVAPVPPASPRRGFAVPINQVMAIVKDIQAGKASDTVHIGPTAVLGVLVSDNDPGKPPGAHVDGALFGTPADEAGMTDGDLITEMDGKRIDSAKTMRAIISGHRPGDVIQFVWTTKEGNPKAAAITLDDGPPN
ncbi:S1C family serine protease [Antrihabitans cavernicola]|uniref:PDZ domain-containing protein n=1 Tax=Antrihabitans cavernicola TaxID=2495913 RepID=A0A5A7S8P1_9NOCA|nr:trypsin-like peptidase domain-containing protein [Spelaeibacter cavernicola]KAA0022296.1 PDZ domain-containing protein [Spelaeibacter cavernicola]